MLLCNHKAILRQQSRKNYDTIVLVMEEHAMTLKRECYVKNIHFLRLHMNYCFKEYIFEIYETGRKYVYLK